METNISMNQSPNFTVEPTAAALSVFFALGRFAVPWLRRAAVSSGCGSALGCKTTP